MSPGVFNFQAYNPLVACALSPQ